MQYQKKLLHRLGNNENWPYFERPDFLDDLNTLADKAYEKNTAEGYLSALLIYHQICEEMIKVLIESSTFYIQLAVLPQQYKQRDLKDKMFGQLINELGNCIIDGDTLKFIQKCRELNKLRIKMVHKITLKNSISDISNQSKQAQSIFNEIFILFDCIYDNYRTTFGDFKKNIDEYYEDLEE